MNPVNQFALSGFRQNQVHSDTESTESYSEDEEELANKMYHDTVSQLAQALMAWSPGLIGPDVAACASHPAASAFAVFLTQLEIEARPRLDLRQEVIVWLKGLGGNAVRQQRVLDTVGENSTAMPAMALYRLLRQPD